MQVHRSILSFIDSASGHRIPSRLEQIWRSAEVTVSGSGLQSVRLQTAAVGHWWLCAVEGTGAVRIEGNRHIELPEGFALATLTRGGCFQSSTYPTFMHEANTLSLIRWRGLEPVRCWGSFGCLILHIPIAELNELAGDKTIPYDCSTSASIGNGAILSAYLRALGREAFGSVDTSPLKETLPELAGLMLKAFRHPTSLSDFRTARPLDRILSYMEENLTDASLTPRRVAAACGLSERKLYRLFAARGESFGVSLRKLRLERSMHLLRHEPGASITDIAYGCGFGSSAYFGQLFKEIYNVTPREFRCGGALESRVDFPARGQPNSPVQNGGMMRYRGC